MSAPAGKARIAGDTDAGRSCPYCRFALKSGASVVDCGSCSATHHDECWSDNGGCAVMGCAGAPPARVAATPARAPVPPPPPALPAAPSPVASRSGGRGTTVLVAAMLAVAIALAGGALALVLSPKGADHAAAPGLTTVVVTQPPTTTAAAPVVPADNSTPAAPPPAPPVVPAAIRRTTDIRAVLRNYYGAVRNGDFDRAWSLLSPTYKNWKVGNGGFAKWELQERHNRAHLRVGSLNVDVRSFDPASGVATIFVTGMRFIRPDGSECAYEGYTWARRNGDGWLYDQGYLQNPARAAKWRPRNQETLGYPCEPSGY